MNITRILAISGIVVLILVAFLAIYSDLSARHSFDICRLFGGTVYEVDGPFAGAHECHIGSKSYNEADDWEHKYPQFHK